MAKSFLWGELFFEIFWVEGVRIVARLGLVKGLRKTFDWRQQNPDFVKMAKEFSVVK